MADTALGMLGVALLAAAWLSTQLAWRRAFPAEGDEPDALAGRPGCRDCSSRDTCAPGPHPDPGAEETP